METILQTQNLAIGYEQKTKTVIADDIGLHFEKGSLISLIGANGIGKSTLLRTITGIQKPLSGKVILNEKEIGTYLPQTIARQLSVVLTEKLPPSNLTVFELISLGRQPYTNWIGSLTPEDITAVNNAMAQTETGHLSAKKHFEISDGQLQKVMIARALAQDTPLIVLDEPTTHLDLQHKVSLFRLLKKLADSGKCVLFSTHDIEMAIGFSTEMVLMFDAKARQGKPFEFIVDGTFDKLFSNSDIAFDREKVKFVYKGN